MSQQLSFNPQETCINNINGRFLVIAGPGTGKTYTVTQRIKNMVENHNIIPDKILCLTFSDTAAKEMRRRVGENYNVNIFTYHGFCLDIMEEYKDEFNLENPKIITDSYKRSLINECIDEIKPIAYNNEKNNPYQYTRDILEGIEEIKKNRIFNKETYFSNLKNNPIWYSHLNELNKMQENKPTSSRQKEIKALEANIRKMEELWDFYELYTKKMSELNYIDFHDMINMVLEKFENDSSDLLKLVSEKYDYVIVDEYQDTNTAQNEIVFQLGKYCPNIFVVGDDDQIIYTFQGAHLDTVEKFLNNFKTDDPIKKVSVICFDKNWRSTQNILDVSQKLANLQDDFCEYMSSKSTLSAKEKDMYKDNKVNLRLCSKPSFKEYGISKKLISSNPDLSDLNKPVEFHQFESSNEERDYIVQKIINIKNSSDFKSKLSEIAILTRTNNELKEYETYLKANGVPVEITGGKNIFEINSVNVLITYMQFLINPELYSDKLLSFLLLRPFHIDPRDYKTICQYKSSYSSLLDNIKNLISKGISENDLKDKLNNVISNTYKNTVIYDVERAIKNEKYVIYNKQKLEKFIETYKHLQKYIAGVNYKNSILEIGKMTGIFSYYFNENINKVENIRGITKLIEEADSYFEVNKNQGNSFTLFVEYLTKIMESGIEVRLDKEDEPMDAVQLSTYHSSKGREFEYVFMPSLIRAKWESSSSSYKDTIPLASDKNDTYETIIEKNNQAKFLDNIKLLYVGMTRAKHSLMLSYAKTDSAGKLSWFINQLINNEELKINKTLIEAENEQFDIDYQNPKYDYDYTQEFKDYVKLNTPKKFSASSLILYKDCPKQYFYKYILGLKSESGNKDNTILGTSVHKAFEYTIKYVLSEKKYPSYDEVYNVFEESINNLAPSLPENLKQCGKEKIFAENKYYDKFISMVKPEEIDYSTNDEINNIPNGKYKIYAEYPLNYELEIPKEWGLELDNFDKIILNGFIDRLDKNPDGTYSIYDYKTREICYNIPPSDNYFYQMVFYKYLFELQNPDTSVKRACFLLPIEKNNNHEINIQDKKDFEKLYEQKIYELLGYIEKILKQEFDVPDKPNCQYCDYKQFCNTKTI